MDLYSIIVIAAFVVALLLGYVIGFGRLLKFFTGGIIGVLISIIVCFMFGGIIAQIPFISELIIKGNAFFAEKSDFLAKIYLATILYYIALFIVVQVVRVIVVKLIAAIFDPKNKQGAINKARSVVNRMFGLLLFGAAYVFLVYLVLAVLALLTDMPSVQQFLATAQEKNTFIYMLYTHNPINLVPLLK